MIVSRWGGDITRYLNVVLGRWLSCTSAYSGHVPRSPYTSFCLQGVFAVMISLALSDSTYADTLSLLDRLVLPPGSAQAALGTRMQLHGVPVDIRVIEIPESVTQAARMLSEQYPGLSDLSVYPGCAVLSGEVADQFWVVTLEPAGLRQTRGSISVLDMAATSFATLNPANGTQSHRSTASPAQSWLPGDARLRLRLDAQEDRGGGHTSQQVWTFPLPVPAAWRAIVRGLQQEQWQLETLTPDAGRWVRQRSTLQITITAVDGGSGILVHQHDGSAR
ncbi:hypothetical protein BOTU111922_03175 [Bordetella tumulicola]